MIPADAYNLVADLAFQARELTIPQLEAAECYIDRQMARGLSPTEGNYMSVVLVRTKEYRQCLLALEQARMAMEKIEIVRTEPRSSETMEAGGEARDPRTSEAR